MKRLRYLSLLCVALCVWNPSMGQDTNYARYIIRSLSDAYMCGRGTAFHGDSMAAQFLRNEMLNMGLLPMGERYYQNYSFSTHAMEGPCMMSVNGKQLRPYYDFRPAMWSNTIIEDDVRFVDLPAETLMDSAALQRFLIKKRERLSDVVIYIDASMYDPLNKTAQERLQKTLRQMQQRNPFGSRGIVVALRKLNTPSPSGCDRIHDYAYIEVLAKSMPKRLKRMDLAIKSSYIANYKTQNVCGYVRGEVDTMIVYTAHYDHLGSYGFAASTDNSNMVGPMVFFPGAHDNASGTAAVLDLAKAAVREQPHYTTVFLLLSGEEYGLKGSTYAAEHPLFDLSKVRLLINLDLFCGGEDGLMVFNANSDNTKPYYDRLVSLNKVLNVAKEVRPRNNSANSDHYPFSKYCPAMYILSMGQPYGGYHDVDDKCDACGLDYYQNYLVLISTLGL